MPRERLSFDCRRSNNAGTTRHPDKLKRWQGRPPRRHYKVGKIKQKTPGIFPGVKAFLHQSQMRLCSMITRPLGVTVRSRTTRQSL